MHWRIDKYMRDQLNDLQALAEKWRQAEIAYAWEHSKTDEAPNVLRLIYLQVLIGLIWLAVMADRGSKPLERQYSYVPSAG